MEVKDVKRGKRVKCLQDSDNVIPEGAEGILIESEERTPYISWDNHYENTYDLGGYQNVYALAHYEIEGI